MKAILFGLVLGGPVEAATVIWDAPSPITGDSDVCTDGTLVAAYNFGDVGVAGSIVSGVGFAPFEVPNNEQFASVGVFSLATETGGYFYSSNIDLGSLLDPFASLSLPYQEILSSACSVDAFGRSKLLLTMGGLSPGQQYIVEFWSSSSTSYFTNVTNKTVYTAGNATSLDSNTVDQVGGVGQWVIGTFQADSGVQVFEISAGEAQNDWLVLNAFQLRTVPEPSICGLLGMCVSLALMRSRIRSGGKQDSKDNKKNKQ